MDKPNNITCPKESHNWEHPEGCDKVCQPEPFPNTCWEKYHASLQNAEQEVTEKE